MFPISKFPFRASCLSNTSLNKMDIKSFILLYLYQGLSCLDLYPKPLSLNVIFWQNQISTFNQCVA